MPKPYRTHSLGIPVTGVSNGMAGWADLILTKALRPPLQCCQWSVLCLGDTNTCGDDRNLLLLGGERDGSRETAWSSRKSRGELRILSSEQCEK